jgi:hypothetical protein
MSAPPLTVGFLVAESNELPAWEYDMLLELLQAEFISGVLLIRMIASGNSQYRNHTSVAFRMFKHFEDAWFRKLPDASSMKDLTGLENRFERLQIAKMATERDLTPVEMDLLYVSFQLKDLCLLSVPEYGIWRVQFGDYRSHRTELPAFWEVMYNELITKAQLKVIIEGKSSEKIAYNANALTVPYSVKNNFNSIAWKASRFLPTRLRELYLTGHSSFFKKIEEVNFGEDYSNRKNELQQPSNQLMLRLFIRNGFRYLYYKIQNLVNHERFVLLYASGKLDISNIDVGKFKKLLPPAKSFWADPFVIEKGNEHFIFFEEGRYPEYKGRLAVIKISVDGDCSEQQIILEKPYHLSYPFVFENKGTYYLMPESSANKTVELYRCKNFPYEWEFSNFLMQDLIMQDSTLFYYKSIWWLFGTTKTSGSSTSNDQLMIYYSHDIFSEKWEPHVGNPVITDVSNCRPAGKIFIAGGKIYRPAQNNASRQYGYSICINEIELLSATEYKESMVGEISPEDHREFKAFHTLNASANMIVIDGIMK